MREAEYHSVHGKGVTTSNPKQMNASKISRIALVQLKANNTSENVLNEIKPTLYSLLRLKEIMNSIHI